MKLTSFEKQELKLAIDCRIKTLTTAIDAALLAETITYLSDNIARLRAIKAKI